jgi:uncharacterized protein YodC (DUF2158 family)
MKLSIGIWSKVRRVSDGAEMIITSHTKRADGSEFYTCKWKEGSELLMKDFSAEELEILD